MKGSVWVSMSVLWASYSLLFVGYCWLRGYDISLLQAVSPVNYYKGPWPPAPFAGTGVIPNGQSGANAANPQGGAALSGAPQAGVQGTVAGGHGR